MKTKQSPIFLLGLLALLVVTMLACSPNRLEPLPIEARPTEQPKERAVTEMMQSVNLPVERSWNVMLDVLADRGIAVDEQNQAEGTIKTGVVRVVDRLCGTYPPSGAPLKCNVWYSIEVSRITAIASSVRISYQESCFDERAYQIECPGSRAEVLMRRIMADLREKAGLKA